ncbi:hypothetical protein ALC62_04797 [Cyphomyrmex costatus]|uniref:Uncharacterized protein n=1 Tax=Cyphomyrmex costatus TaxID=456900 RepID=A0A195CTK7_9HYME|nr:hypothetical protein ALC62_04797 [Cyphomyrmex costatus]
MRTLTSVRVYLARGQCSIRYGRVLFTIGRAAAAFSDNPMAKPEYRRGMSMQLGIRISGKLEKKSKRNPAFALCFPLLLAKLAERVNVYTRVYKHGRKRRNAQKSRKVKETVSAMPFALSMSGSCISQVDGINS